MAEFRPVYLKQELTMDSTSLSLNKYLPFEDLRADRGAVRRKTSLEPQIVKKSKSGAGLKLARCQFRSRTLVRMPLRPQHVPPYSSTGGK
jgi:hypothetical protein